MRYEGVVYRPPSEAYSYILPVTNGCSHNRCAFCNMYLEKRFYIRPLADILEDLRLARQAYRHVERIFLADGDALVCSTELLCAILDEIARLFPECGRVSSYATAGDILRKSPEELAVLRQKGLRLLYLGLETGSDALLEKIHKGVTAAQMIAACRRAIDAGMQMSVTEITGLAGPEGMAHHAAETARVLSAMNPTYIGIVTLTLRRGTEMTRQLERGEFRRLSPLQIVEEMKLMLEGLDSPGSILRSNHISNYVSLRGTMNTDKARMLRDLEAALRLPDLRNEHIRYLENI